MIPIQSANPAGRDVGPFYWILLLFDVLHCKDTSYTQTRKLTKEMR
jgi:hypothetical protein